MSVNAWEFPFDPTLLPQPWTRTVEPPLPQGTATPTPKTTGQLWPR